MFYSYDCYAFCSLFLFLIADIIIASLLGSALNIYSVMLFATACTCLTVSFLKPSLRNLLRTGSALVDCELV